MPGGPCLCGDPACGRCCPGGAELEAALEAATNDLAEAGLRPDEIRLAVDVGIEAVRRMKPLIAERQQLARDEERLFLESAGRRGKDVHKPG